MGLSGSSHRHRMRASANEYNLKECSFLSRRIYRRLLIYTKVSGEVVIDLMWPVT